MNEDKKNNPCCLNCTNCIYIGEGDSMCDVDKPVIVLEDWIPSGDYFCCGGADYIPVGSDEE